MKKIVACFCCSLFVLLAVSVSAQEKHEIKYGFPIGKYTMSQTTKTKMSITLNESMSRLDTRELTFRFNLDILPPDEAGNSKMNMEIVQVKLMMKSGQREISVDTASETDYYPLVTKPLRAMIGGKFIITFDKTGKAVKLDGIDELVNRIALAYDTPQGKQVTAQMKESISAAKILDSFNRFRDILPVVPVEIGYKWSQKIEDELPNVGKVEMNVDFTFQGKEKLDDTDVYRIRSVGGIKYDERKTFETAEGKSTLKELKKDSKGQWLVDAKTGLPRSNVNSAETLIHMALEPSENAARPQFTSIKTQVNAETTVSFEIRK